MGNNQSRKSNDKKMITLTPIVLATEHDFSNFDIDLLSSEKILFDYHSMSREFTALAKESQSSSHRCVYDLLSAICSFHSKIDDPNEPWGPLWQGPNGRSYVPSDFCGEQNNILSTIVQKIVNLPLRARIADVVWSNDKTKKNEACIAVGAYCDIIIKYGNREEGNEDSYIKISSMEKMFNRAMQITALSRKKSDLSDDLLKAFEVIRLKTIDAKNYVLYERISRLGCNKKLIDWSVISLEASNLASQAENTSNPEAVKKVWYLAATAFEKIGDKGKSDFCKEKAVEQTLRMRDEVSQSSAKAHWVSVAISELRAMGGQKERISKLFEEQRLLQMVARDDIATFTTPIDTEKERAETEKVYSELSLSDCFLRFALEPFIIPKTSLREHADSIRKKSFFSSFMSSVHTDNEGKVYAKTPAAPLDERPSEEWYKSENIKTLNIVYHNFINGVIFPARYSLSARFSIEERHFETIVVSSPFIPPSHRYIFMLGFSRMFQGDYVSSAYLLIPQLENSIRYYMLNLNRDTSKMDNDLIQEDRSLSGMLENLKIDLEEVFGEDLINIFDLLFNYKPGPSLRHEVAHGKLSSNDCLSAAAICACWLIYHLACWPLINSWETHIAPSIDELE
ncbi:TPA: DUF4209 domain-containing protein [Enterobacter asburiae]|nr:DUF4209 domain-containing protein [Enterobacter asburiae]HDR2803690.1 DUF4209 domain-containing protein [Enterobacter asburiae]HDR2809017.1 DUF4209 domain-containing protein [Enterobacter asburiae]HDR2814391.1 DUF4209 domain-containing protein [Enterobacter asburiae]